MCKTKPSERQLTQYIQNVEVAIFARLYLLANTYAIFEGDRIQNEKEKEYSITPKNIPPLKAEAQQHENIGEEYIYRLG